MNSREVCDFLTEQGIPYEITRHKAVFNMEQLQDVVLPYPEADAKNLFVRDDKHQHFYLLTVRGNRRVDLKQFRKQFALRPLSFASDEELYEKLSLTPGSVTPFGLLNSSEADVEFFIDSCFAQEGALVGCHPNDNTATLWLAGSDLLRLIRNHGNPVHLL